MKINRLAYVLQLFNRIELGRGVERLALRRFQIPLIKKILANFDFQSNKVIKISGGKRIGGGKILTDNFTEHKSYVGVNLGLHSDRRATIRNETHTSSSQVGFWFLNNKNTFPSRLLWGYFLMWGSFFMVGLLRRRRQAQTIKGSPNNA